MQSACLSKVCEHGLWFRFEDQTEACSAWGLWRRWINMAWLTSLKTSWRHGKVSVAPTCFDLLHHPWNLEIEHVAYHSQTCMLELGLDARSLGAFPSLLKWFGPFSSCIAPTCREAFARCPSMLTRKVCFQGSSKFIARRRELHSSHFPKIRVKFYRAAADMPLSSSSLVAVWADLGLGRGLAVSKHRAPLKSCGLYMFIVAYQHFPHTSKIRWP